ncbi:DNA packaging protein [Aneurinibacillus aneurinilyticus]|uniref:DNA packaging protein n=1 Tax=Aneurinibacillus aneurinilyticus TaxID=1391 RepID=UPI002E24D9E8|nr:DNA packaging protein [Aneurinibacillus aneurinilyticus]
MIEIAREIKKKIRRFAKNKGREKALRLIDIIQDFEQFCARCLRIKTKEGGIVPLILNDAQKKLVETVLEQLLKGKPVRIIILKARQMGFSTTAEAIVYYFSSLTEARNSKIVAHDNAAASNLYDMFKTYYENVPGVVRPMRKYDNAKKMTFENPTKDRAAKRKKPGLNSKITVESAQAPTMGRSDTIHYLHISELAHWPESKKQKHLLALNQALSDAPGTICIIESTANGIGEPYHRQWEEAVSGQSSYIPLFFAWHEFPSYRMDFENEEELHAFIESMDATEKELQQRFNLTAEQLKWRRRTIIDKCNNDVKQFQQEYPSFPEEAFLVSGRPIFNQEQIQHDIMHAPDPIRKDFDDRLWIWEEPQPGEKYEIGSDVAEGLDEDENDASTAVVFKRRTGEIVATLQCWEEPFDHARLLDKLGRMYNNAKLAPERNNHGHAVLLALMEIFRYPNLYTHRDYDQKGNLLEKEGFPTTQKTRPQIVEDYRTAYKDGLIRIPCRRLLREMRTFVKRRGKAQHQEGCRDDILLAAMIGWFIRGVALESEPIIPGGLHNTPKHDFDRESGRDEYDDDRSKYRGPSL